MNIRSIVKRFRNYILTGTIFLVGMCCGMSLVVIVSAPTPTPTSIVQRIVSQTPVATQTVVPSTTTPNFTAMAITAATVTITTTIQPSDTATPLPSLTYTPTQTPTRLRATAFPTNTKRALPATNTPRNGGAVTTQTPAATSAATSELTSYEEQVKLALSVFASKRNIVSVEVTDDRANGGQRVIVINYRTIETDLEARVKELMDIYVVVGAIINADNQDIDSVKLMIADQDGKALAVSTASKQDLVRYDNGEISLEELVKLVKVESVTE